MTARIKALYCYECQETTQHKYVKQNFVKSVDVWVCVQCNTLYIPIRDTSGDDVRALRREHGKRR